MRKKNYKGRCEKQTLEKFTTVCKTYEPIQAAYAIVLSENEEITEVRCNVVLDGDCSEYMTDFVCKKTNGDLMVRECIRRKLLSRPQMTALLEMSRTYWLRHGVTDWGVVVDTLKELIEGMGFECSQVLQMHNGSFAKDSFVYIPTTKEPPKKESYLFWLDRHYSHTNSKGECSRAR